jgi:glycosyltransferase involved in cell wall biosynthesis
VLDFVDSLARSYHDRALISTSVAHRALFRGLSVAHRRFERTPVPASVRRVAAGWSDARHLNAEWIPILAPLHEPLRTGHEDVDVIFFGNLSYLPNVDALRRLARIWPELRRRSPTISGMIAGARPTPEIRDLAREHSWEVVADFDNLRSVASRARLACFPLTHTAGIQIKVLEAASLGLAQVVSPPALAGLEPGFPVTVADGDAAMVDAILSLLGDNARRSVEAADARRCVVDLYGAARWTPWTSSLLEDAQR